MKKRARPRHNKAKIKEEVAKPSGSKFWLILGLIATILTIALGIYSIYTYKQVNDLKSAVDDANSHPEDIQELSRGNCSVFPDIERRTLNVKDKATVLCENFGIKLAISRNITIGGFSLSQLCIDISGIDKPLAQIKEICATRMNSTAK